MEQYNGRAERVVQQSRALGDDVRGLASEIAGAAHDIKGKVDISSAVQTHPFRSIFIAAGVGYLVGGGLFTPMTGRLLRVGLRAMLVPMIKNQMDAMVAGSEQRT
jgi:hypothetical protein